MVVGFIRVLVGSMRRARGLWVHSCSRGFTQEHLGVIWVRLGSLVRAKRVVVFIPVSLGSFLHLWSHWVHSGSRWFTRTRLRRVYSASPGYTRVGLMVVGFIRVLVGSIGGANGSSGSIGFA